MKKIRLTLEKLEVESFATTNDYGAERGTVRGHDSIPSEPSGVGCGSVGCESVSGLEWCICEHRKNTTEYTNCNCG